MIHASGPCQNLERSGDIGSVRLEVGQRAMGQRPFVGRAQGDAWRAPRNERFLPARRAKAPAVAVLEARKPKGRHRRRQIVAPRLRKRKESIADDGADGVAAPILSARVATSISEKPGHRFGRTGFQDTAEGIAGRRSSAARPGRFVAKHRAVPLNWTSARRRGLDRPRNLVPDPHGSNCVWRRRHRLTYGRLLINLQALTADEASSGEKASMTRQG